MEDRRRQIIAAGLALLREEGLPGFTQPRVAARAGLRQSHLTYYYPTRSELLAGVANAAIEIQAADAKAMLKRIASVKGAADVIAAGTARLENTRVLLALCEAAQQEPAVRASFDQLADGSFVELVALLTRLGLEPTSANADLVHALFIGLSITQLATGRVDGQKRAKAALASAFALLASTSSTGRNQARAPAAKTAVRFGENR